MKKYSIAGFTIVALLFGTWYFASPYYSLSGLRDAAVAGDAGALEDHVDFISLRKSVKTELKSKMAEAKPEQGSGPLADITSIFADRLLDGMIDGMMTPDGIARVIEISNKKGDNASNSNESSDFDKWHVDRDGLSTFRLSNTQNENSPILIFKRDGLSWKLSDVDMRNVKLPSEI